MNRYAIDPGRSRLTVQAFAAGLLSTFAHSPTFAVRDFGGEVRLGTTAETLELDLEVNPDSLDLVDRLSATERREIETRMRSEVLETLAYRKIAYHARAVRAETIDRGRYRVSLEGDLNLHGTARPHRIDAELIVFGDGLRLGGVTVLRMSEHGIGPVTALAGTIKLKDELRFTFDLAALPESS